MRSYRRQVRKYLLKLEDQKTKFWRAQLLLVCPSPVGRISLLELANQLKKGGVLIVGDVIVPPRYCSAPGVQPDIGAWRARVAQWQSLVQQAKLKAFVSVLSSPSLR